MVVPITPRLLGQDERGVLEHILSADFPGAAELRRQLGEAEVVALWVEGSVSVDLRVPETVPRARLASGVAPVTATVVDDAGELIGEILIWTEEGRMAALEFAWYGEEAPASLPTAEQIQVSLS